MEYNFRDWPTDTLNRDNNTDVWITYTSHIIYGTFVAVFRLVRPRFQVEHEKFELQAVENLTVTMPKSRKQNLDVFITLFSTFDIL